MITKKFEKTVKSWFYHYKKVLGLSPSWHIKILINEQLTCYAQVVYNYQKKEFAVNINPKLNQRLNVLKDSILHECLHILFSPATSRLDTLLEKLQKKKHINPKSVAKNMNAWEEYLIDRLTKIFIKLEGENDSKLDSI